MKTYNSILDVLVDAPAHEDEYVFAALVDDEIRYIIAPNPVPENPNWSAYPITVDNTEYRLLCATNKRRIGAAMSLVEVFSKYFGDDISEEIKKVGIPKLERLIRAQYQMRGIGIVPCPDEAWSRMKWRDLRQELAPRKPRVRSNPFA